MKAAEVLKWKTVGVAVSPRRDATASGWGKDSAPVADLAERRVGDNAMHDLGRAKFARLSPLSAMDTAVGHDHLEQFVLELRLPGYTLDRLRATELLRIAVARTLTHVRLARDLSERGDAARENIGCARG